MAYASYPQEGPSGTSDSPFFGQQGAVDTKKTLAKCFGYMALGLAVTAATAFLASFLLAYLIAIESDAFAIVYFGFIIVGVIGLLVDGIVANLVIAKNKHSAWVPFLLYSFFMGMVLSSVLIAGVDFKTVGEAFGLTALAFLAMFLIGYFSKANLNILGMVLGVIGITFLMFASLWGLTILLSGNSAAYFAYDMIVSGVIVILSIVVVAIDAYNIKKLIERGNGMKNLALYCAYQMYCDFIVIFLRVLIILAASSGRSKK